MVGALLCGSGAKAAQPRLATIFWPRVMPRFDARVGRGYRDCSGKSGDYPLPDLARLGTADLADYFVGDVHDCEARISESPSIWQDGRPRVQALAALPRFFDFGGNVTFSGRIATVQCFGSNLAMRVALEEPGQGRVLVVDAGASPRAAVFGDNLADLAVKNGWAGLLINGFLRDVDCLRDMPLGVKALGAHPVKSGKREWGATAVPLSFHGVGFRPGDYLYSDDDGVLVADADLAALVAGANKEDGKGSN
eukprot:CAMPEP_0117477700 /NCGR_PEP_ID=MMETSP0784-20121206/10960_1 /TAXON_ID=39447 /ORGANISM="" /LENGTH=250 /DNA_ID=CAMNT_0005272015 /DNA_START=35 /DNA_END=787 /DNA_ORIENTATION=-